MHYRQSVALSQFIAWECVGDEKRKGGASMSAPAFVPATLEHCTMMLIYRYFQRTGRQWSYIDQEWMLEKLREWYGVARSRRALCYALRDLEAAGMIERVQRHTKDRQTGKFTPMVTLYRFTRSLRAWGKRLAKAMSGRAPVAAPSGRLIRPDGKQSRPLQCDCGGGYRRGRGGVWTCSNCTDEITDAQAAALDKRQPLDVNERRNNEPASAAGVAADWLNKLKGMAL